MANDKIVTKGDGTEIVSTRKAQGEGGTDWAERHDDALDNASVSGVSVLETCWPNPTAVGGECCESTTRNTGESDSEFRERHELEYSTKMISCPPIVEEPPPS